MNKRIRKKVAKRALQNRTKTYHGMTLVVNGNIVGRITSWETSTVTLDRDIVILDSSDSKYLLNGNETFTFHLKSP